MNIPETCDVSKNTGWFLIQLTTDPTVKARVRQSDNDISHSFDDQFEYYMYISVNPELPPSMMAKAFLAEFDRLVKDDYCGRKFNANTRMMRLVDIKKSVPIWCVPSIVAAFQARGLMVVHEGTTLAFPQGIMALPPGTDRKEVEKVLLELILGLQATTTLPGVGSLSLETDENNEREKLELRLTTLKLLRCALKGNDGPSTEKLIDDQVDQSL